MRTVWLSIAGAAAAVSGAIVLLTRGNSGTYSEQFHYDAAGLLSRWETPDGRSVRYSYDREQRLTRVLYLSGEPAVEYAYDLAGNLTATQDASGQTRYTYDELDRLVEVTTPQGKTLRYRLDPWGRVASIMLPDRERIDHHYDLFGNLVRVADAHGETSFEYRRSEVHRRLPNGVLTVFRFEPAGLLVYVRHSGPKGELISEFRYERDAYGRIRSIHEETPRGLAVTRFEYDSLARLAAVELPGGEAVRYTYDPMGNRTSEGTGRATILYRYDAQGRLIRKGDTRYYYDRAGNLVRRTEPGQDDWEFDYDSDNHLVACRQGGKVLRFRYNAMGNRLAREADSSTVTYLNDVHSNPPQMLAEYDHSGNVRRRYLYAGTRIGQRDSNGEALYYLEDHLGSVRYVTDAHGRIVSSRQYDAFGHPVGEQGNAAVDFAFAGAAWEPGPGLLFLDARYYDPAAGRFLSRDPYPPDPFEPQSFNRYAYALNDPVNLVDPTGLAPQDPQVPGTRRTSDPYRPRQTEQWQKTWEDIGIGGLTRYPGWGGRAIAAVSAFEHGVLEKYVRPVEINLRKLSDPHYAAGRPALRAWTGIQLAFDVAGVLNVKPSAPSAMKISLGKSTSLSERIRIFETGKQWTELRTYLPFGLDPRYPGSRSLRFSLDKAYQAYKAGSKSVELAERLDLHPSLVRNVARLAVETNPVFRLADPAAPRALLSGFIQTAARLSSDPAVGKAVDVATKAAARLNPLAHLLDAFDSATRRKFYLPPPGRGSGAVPVGGVRLDKAAELIGDLGEITAAVYDAETGRLVLIGDKTASLPDMRLDDFAVALRAVYADKPDDPSMSIDPDPRNPKGETMRVVFFANTANTHFGWVMFEADRCMKCFSVGKDNITRSQVESAVQGYDNLVQLGFALPGSSKAGLWSRFWIEPLRVELEPSPDGGAVRFGRTVMHLRTETMRWDGGRLVPARGQKDDAAEHFAGHFSAHYDKFAQERPIFAEVKRLAQMVALAKWMKRSGIAVDMDWVERHAGRRHETPATTPSVTNSMSQGGGSSRVITTIDVYGGTLLKSEPVFIAGDGSAVKVKNIVSAALRANAENPAIEFALGGKTHKGVVLAGPAAADAGSFNLEETDLVAGLPENPALELKRFYNSFRNHETQLGRGWSFGLPRLYLMNRMENGKTQTLSVGGRPDTRVTVREFQLADDTGYSNEHFRRPFVDQQLGRIGFAPDGSALRYRGLYPHADGTFMAVRADGDWWQFDERGRLLRSWLEGRLTEYEHSKEGLLARVSTHGEDISGYAIRFEYDAGGRITQALASDGRTVQYSYDSAGNLTSVRKPDGTTFYSYDHKHLLVSSSENGKILSRVEYDEGGRWLRRREGSGKVTAEQKIERSGDATVVTATAEGRTARFHYDRSLRLTAVHHPDGSSAVYSYHRSGSVRRVDVTDPLGRKAAAEMSEDRSAIHLVDVRGIRQEFRFDPAGKLLGVAVNGRSVGAFHYDADGLPAMIDYGGFREHFEHDGDRRLAGYSLGQLDPRTGQWRREEARFNYDAQGRLSGVVGPQGEKLEFHREGGRLIGVSDGSSTTQVAWDSQGRVSAVAGPGGRQVGLEYERGEMPRKVTLRVDGRTASWIVREGRPEQVIGFRGEETRYEYHEDGSLKAVIDADKGATRLTRGREGRLLAIGLPSGSRIEYEHDSGGRITGIRERSRGRR